MISVALFTAPVKPGAGAWLGCWYVQFSAKGKLLETPNSFSKGKTWGRR